MEKKTAFVTGATGFVGRNLVTLLLEEGWEVTALHRPGADVSHLAGTPVKLAQGDITQPQSLAEAMPQQVGAVFHVAASTNMWSRRNAAQDHVNIGGTENMVAEALRKRAGVFIHTSTVSAYGMHAEPISEETPSNAADCWINYVRSKWLAEEEVRKGAKHGLEAVIINPCAIMGPGDVHGWAQFFFLVNDGKLKGIPPGEVTFNDVRQVARSHLAAVTKGRRGANYLLDGETVSFTEMLRMMAEELGVPLKAKVTSKGMLMLIARIQAVVAALTGRPPELSPEMATLVCERVICNTDRARKELGHGIVPLRTSIRDSLAWLRENGKI